MHDISAQTPGLCVYCRAKYDNKPLLTGGHLNVLAPTMLDVANSLPSAWETDVCKCTGESGATHPTHKWLKQFWSLMASSLTDKPNELDSFALVPITGNRLASIAHCRHNGALALQHLQGMPDSAATTLTAIGCVCIADRRAESASPIHYSHDSLTTALEAVSCQTGIPLKRLLSRQRLGVMVFHQARQLLAHHVCTSEYWNKDAPAVWQILRQCPLFEDVSGSMVPLLASQKYGLLPSASWEQRISELSQLLPWTPVRYHKTSELQRQLLKHSGMKVPSIPQFLRSDLLPAIKSAGADTAQPLLLQALDELAGQPNLKVSTLTEVFVNGSLQPISKCVDGTTSMFRSLFSQHERLSTYILLPDVYSTPQRLAVLRAHGLAHEGTPDTDFFIMCSERFTAVKDDMSRDDSRRLSRGLANMLQSNVESYKHIMIARFLLPRRPVFKTADLPFPYTNHGHPAFTSLRGSADHDHYRLVALAIPVTDNSHGDTKELRAKLGLPTEPELQHVVDHLLKMAATGYMESLSKHTSNPMYGILLQDLEAAYQYIVKSISQQLARPEGADSETARVAVRLAEEPWVLVKGCMFVKPHELCFDLEEGTPHGNLFALR